MLASHPLAGLTVALGIGLLVGIERERNKGEGATRAAAGVRTFALVALTGAIAELLGGVAIAVAGGFVALAALASYRHTRTRDPGLTTEVAMLAVFLLGILAMRDTTLAAGLGVAVAILLAGKGWLHGFARHALSADELHDALLLAASAAIVLPLLPDHAVDPWQVLNPRKLWLLAVLVMTINAAGHIALRVLGERLGLMLAGFLGGFVSSTATIASMGSRARDMPSMSWTCAGAGALSNVSTIVQLAAVTGVLSTRLLREIAMPLVAAGAVVVVFAMFAGWHSKRDATPETMQLTGRAFKPGQVFGFVGIVAVVLLVSGMVMSWLGDRASVVALAISGFADVHAAAASAAQLVTLQRLDADSAALAVLLALAANSLTKVVVAFSTGGRAYGLRLLPGIASMFVAFAGVLLMQ
ncbi:MAG: MgtC/SapB family protein [Luteimonas sp.]